MEKDFRQIAFLKFRIRDRLLGRIRIRSGDPELRNPLEPSSEGEFYRLLLARAFSPDELADVGLVLDVGSRNGSYLPALARACPGAAIRGIELDGGRRYWNGYRRADYGQAYAKALRENGRDCQYVWSDARNASADTLTMRGKGPFLITIFYPFVSEAPCASWGLPTQYADFNSLLQSLRTLFLSVPGGSAQLLCVHQGEWEADLARRAYENASLDVSEGRVERAEFSGFWPSEYPALFFRTRFC